MSEKQEKKKRYNQKLGLIQQFEAWAASEPPIWMFLRWKKWLASRPQWWLEIRVKAAIRNDE